MLRAGKVRAVMRALIRHSDSMSRVAIVCFAIVSVAVVAIVHDDVLRARSSDDGLARPAGALAETAASAPAPRPARETLPTLALFGVERDEVSPEATPAATETPLDSTLPASTAPLRLFGVIAAATPEAARAFIGSDDAAQLMLRPGERTPDGAALFAVSARGVVLERDGRREWLALPMESATVGAAPPVRPRFMPRPTARLGTPTDRPRLP